MDLIYILNRFHQKFCIETSAVEKKYISDRRDKKVESTVYYLIESYWLTKFELKKTSFYIILLFNYSFEDGKL